MNQQSSTPSPQSAAPEIYDERDRLVILTPCYGGLVTTLFRDSLDFVRGTAPRANFRCADGKIRSLPIVAQAINYPGDSHIDRARNNLLHDFEQTHYRFGLWCDGDQPFEPEDIAMTWLRLMTGVRVLGGSVALKAIKTFFACNTIGNTKTPDPVTKLLPGRDTGTGWMAFNRDVLDQMRTEWPKLVRRKIAEALGPDLAAPDGNGPTVDRVVHAMAKLGYSADLDYVVNAGTAKAGQTIHAYFASGVTLRDGHGDWLSEDWLFCHRCLQLGIEIKIDPMIRIKHLGPYLFPPPPDDLVDAALQVTGGARPPFNPALAKAAHEALQALHDDIHNQSISVLHATRGRAAQALKIREEWLATASSKDFEYIFACDEDDTESRQLLAEAGAHVVIVPPSGGIVAPINAAAGIAKGRILMMAADDCHPPQHWDREVRTALKSRLHEPLVLATSDGHSQQVLIPHPIMTRAFYEAQGWFFCPEYRHLFCDTELTVRAQAARQIVDATHLVFRHDNPMFTGEQPDALAQARNSRASWAEGQAVFKRRNPDSGHAHAQ